MVFSPILIRHKFKTHKLKIFKSLFLLSTWYEKKCIVYYARNNAIISFCYFSTLNINVKVYIILTKRKYIT